MSESLHQDPLAILHNNFADITSVKHCLDLYISQIKTHVKSPAAEQKAHKRDNSAEKALLWLLDSGAVDNVDLRSHEELLACLASCIAAQGKNDAFLQWFNIPHVPRFAVDWPLIEQRRWKASALRQFIEAIAFFSTRTSGLEDSIDTFLELVSPAPHPHAPALARAGMWIRDQIVVNDQAKLLKQDLFRSFRESIPFWIKNKGECWFQQSQLDLARGDCDSALFALSSQATKATLSAYFDESLEISPRHFDRMLFCYLVRLARSLHQQGRYAEAFAVLRYGRAKSPTHFAVQSIDAFNRQTHEREQQLGSEAGAAGVYSSDEFNAAFRYAARNRANTPSPEIRQEPSYYSRSLPEHSKSR